MWCWRRLLRVPWTARRSNQSILEEISPGKTDAEAETLVFCFSVAKSCPTLCDPMDCSTPGLLFPISWRLLKFMSIESGMLSNHLILCHFPLLLPSIFPRSRVFSNESVLLIRWPKYWSFSFSISPSSEYSGLISSRIDWFDLLSAQGTLNPHQHVTTKADIASLPRSR